MRLTYYPGEVHSDCIKNFKRRVSQCVSKSGRAQRHFREKNYIKLCTYYIYLLKLLLKNVKEILFEQIFWVHTTQTVSKYVWVRRCISLRNMAGSSDLPYFQDFIHFTYQRDTLC